MRSNISAPKVAGVRHGRRRQAERDEPAAEGTHASGAARAGRSRGAAKGRHRGRQAHAQGISGPKGSGAHALWRLGKQGYRVRFLVYCDDLSENRCPLRANAALRIRVMRQKKAALSRGFALTMRRDQRVTTTLVPTETRLNRS